MLTSEQNRTEQNRTEQKVILQELSLYTTFLAGALSSLAAPTFCELLLGMAFPSPKSGNISKLKIAKAMLKSVRQTLQGRVLRLFTDCWFMNHTMVQPALELGYEVIGHIPKNRVLYALPVETLPPSPFKRKYRTVSFRSCICRARFLKASHYPSRLEPF